MVAHHGLQCLWHVFAVALFFEGFEPELQSLCIVGYIANFSILQIGAQHKPNGVFVSPACVFQMVRQQGQARLFGKEPVGCGNSKLRIYKIRTRARKHVAVEHGTQFRGLKAAMISNVRSGGTPKHRVNTRICVGVFPLRRREQWVSKRRRTNANSQRAPRLSAFMGQAASGLKTARWWFAADLPKVRVWSEILRKRLLGSPHFRGFVEMLLAALVAPYGETVIKRRARCKIISYAKRDLVTKENIVSEMKPAILA